MGILDKVGLGLMNLLICMRFLYRHDYKAVRMDIELWWPKLKEGGLMVVYT